MMVLMCCLCVACCTVILRLRCRSNQNSRRISGNLDAMERRAEANAEAETEARNRRLYEARQREA